MASSPIKLKFAANISTMFQDLPITDRFEAAKKKGFTAVEAQCLYEYDPKSLREAKLSADIDVVLINSPLGDVDTFGLASVPGQEVGFIKSIQQATVYANAVDCKTVHIMAGTKRADHLEDDLFNIYLNNMRVGVEMLEEYNLSAVIEPICKEVKENYFLDSFDKAVQIISEVNSPNLKLLLDVYHLHMLGLNPESSVPSYLEYAGHVQISQAPQRNEPFATGLIDYEEVLNILQERKYNGYIGLEYTPSDPVKGFEWLESYGF
ncbi:putative hydroxypyruvate isomerase [Nephila pilipes]|uniref:Putative hydroxypyruvate isomerase n=1 Tax=Nephila pilipes TaxID=299642 RepID=A0A8X6MT98_NEPPI|nr:putative hydroxypyruvate isomerase [Nephila pilipes]